MSPVLKSRHGGHTLLECASPAGAFAVCCRAGGDTRLRPPKAGARLPHSKGGERDAFLNSGNGKGVTEHMWGYGTGNTGTVGKAFNEPLDRPRRHADGVMQSKVAMDEWLDTLGQRHNAAFGFGTVWATLTVDREAV